MSELVNLSEFAPIIALIKCAEASPGLERYYFEISVPSGLLLDMEKIKGIFNEDVTLEFQRTETALTKTLKGTIADENLGWYLWAAFQKP